MEENKFMVCVRCMTYNHSSFIEETMNGFCAQQTSFPFICAIIDDASTDGEPEVIRNYLQNHFNVGDRIYTRIEETDDYELIYARHKSNNNCYFVVLFLKYNHYRKKPKHSYISEWRKNSKYIALCEGDDYWIDTHKLQIQVDFLETHPDHTMTCNRTLLYSNKRKKYIGENYCYDHNSVIDTKDVIYRGGLFISTCSIVYRKEIKDNYPDYCKRLPVGDYPLQIMAAMKGKIYYFDKKMSVYRVSNANSWMGKQQWGTISEQNLNRIDKMINMFKGFSTDYPEYKKLFDNRIAHYLISQYPRKNSNQGKDLKKYIEYYQLEFDKFPILWKLINRIRLIKNPLLRSFFGWCIRPIFSEFKEKKIKYIVV